MMQRDAARTALSGTFLVGWMILVAAAFWAGLATAEGDPQAPRVDLNRASLEELESLPGIGPARAMAIDQWRQANGPFERPEHLQRVSGIGPTTWARLCARVEVEGTVGCLPGTLPSGPEGEPGAGIAEVAINTASAEELMTLPGIGERRAALIVEDRDRRGPFASVDDLTRISGIGERTVETLRPWVRITIDVNAASLEELLRIPALSAEQAAALVDDRDERGPYTALESLVRVDGILPSHLETLSQWLHVAPE